VAIRSTAEMKPSAIVERIKDGVLADNLDISWFETQQH